MNRLSAELETGTLGELLVQLRLLQYDVQAAPPLKDTGNDLIAVRGRVMKAIQIKTTRNDRTRPSVPSRIYHLQAVVRLVGDGRDLHLDRCEVFLFPVRDIPWVCEDLHRLEKYRLGMDLIDRLFPRTK